MVQLQENALKFYMGMPMESQINIPQSQFELLQLLLQKRQTYQTAANTY
jgi:hypothetical protein